jgi:hypothetical protein
MGGHYLGDAQEEKTAIRLVREAVDGGITFLRWREMHFCEIICAVFG